MTVQEYQSDIKMTYSHDSYPLETCEDSKSILEYVLKLSVSTLIFGLLGFISNFIFLITVAKHPKLRKTNLRILLVTLSVIDALISMCYIFISLRWLIDSSKYLITLHESLVLLFRFPFQFISCICITLVTTERYQAISNPMKYVNQATMKVRSCYIFAITICAFLIVCTCVVFMLVFLVHPKWEIITYCQSDLVHIQLQVLGSPFHHEMTVDTAVKIFSYVLVSSEILAVIISVTLSLMIYRKLGKLPNVGDESERLHIREQRNLTIMVFVNTAVFCICVILQDIFTCVYFNLGIDDKGNVSKHYICFIAVVTLLNSLLNPLIYNMFGSIYRQAFVETFPFVRRFAKFCKRNSGYEIPSTTTKGSLETSLNI